MKCINLMDWCHVFVDGFVTLRHCMLCQFTWQYQRGSSLNISCSHCWFLCVLAASSSLRADSLKNILNKAVQHLHCSLWYSDLWVHLLQYFVDVDVVWFMSLSSAWSSSRFSFCRHNNFIWLIPNWNLIAWFLSLTLIQTAPDHIYEWRIWKCIVWPKARAKFQKEDMEKYRSNWQWRLSYWWTLWMRSDRRSSWIVIGDFCYSVSGLTHFSHSL